MLRAFLTAGFSFWVLSCSAPAVPIDHGVLDLRGYTWSDPVPLRGDWRFYWNELRDPAQALEGDSFLKVPGSWNSFRSSSGPAAGPGYGTYALRIVTTDPPPLRLRYVHFDSAFVMYVNGERVASSGKVDADPARYWPARRPGTAEAKPHNGEINIVIHVANFDHRNGGFPRDLWIGPAERVELLREHRIMMDLFLMGALLMIGVYHLALFFLRPRDRSPLFFGIFCLLIGIRTDLVGEHMLWYSFFPENSAAFSRRLEYITFYLSVPIFAAYVSCLFPGRFFGTYFVRSTSAVFTAGTLLVLILSSYRYTQLLWFFQAALAACGVYVMAGGVWQVMQRRPGGRVFLATALFLFATSINDILYSRAVVNSGFTVSAGLLLFVFTQAFLLSRLYAESFRRIEELAVDLSNSEKRYRHLVEDSAEIILSLDPGGRILTANQAASRVLGYMRLEGRSLTELIFEQPGGSVLFDRRLLEDRLARLNETGEASEFSAHFRTSQGDLVELNVRLQRVNLEGGSAILANLAQRPLDVLARYCLEDRRAYSLVNSFHLGDQLNQSITAGILARVSEDELMLMRLALREVIINAIEHGNLAITFEEKSAALQNGTLSDLIAERLKDPVLAERRIYVRVDSDENEISFTVRDEGRGFDHRSMLARARASIAEPSNLFHGRGVAFAINYFDTVEYNEAGNEVTLRRRFSSQPGASQ